MRSEDASRGCLYPEGLRARLCRRDPEAVDRFIHLYGPRIRAHLRGLTQDEHVADDLTQDVLLRVYDALPGYDPLRDPGPWVFTIATNKLRDAWRAGVRQPVRQSDEGVEPFDLLSDTRELAPEARASCAELAQRVRAAIEVLPVVARDVLHMRLYEGRSFEEIALLVGRDVDAVRKRYSRALARLRELLVERWSADAVGVP